MQPLAGARLRTGDIGCLDGESYLVIVDRLKDMINIAGFKVWPSQLEAVLNGHPAVKETSAIGVPDERTGERPKAFVVLRAGMQASADELLDYPNRSVGKHERAQLVEIRDSLPRTMIGKPSRKDLAAEERYSAPAGAARAA